MELIDLFPERFSGPSLEIPVLDSSAQAQAQAQAHWGGQRPQQLFQMSKDDSFLQLAMRTALENPDKIVRIPDPYIYSYYQPFNLLRVLVKYYYGFVDWIIELAKLPQYITHKDTDVGSVYLFIKKIYIACLHKEKLTALNIKEMTSDQTTQLMIVISTLFNKIDYLHESNILPIYRGAFLGSFLELINIVDINDELFITMFDKCFDVINSHNDYAVLNRYCINALFHYSTDTFSTKYMNMYNFLMKRFAKIIGRLFYRIVDHHNMDVVALLLATGKHPLTLFNSDVPVPLVEFNGFIQPSDKTGFTVVSIFSTPTSNKNIKLFDMKIARMHRAITRFKAAFVARSFARRGASYQRALAQAETVF